jgi:hypothetical protein
LNTSKLLLRLLRQQLLWQRRLLLLLVLLQWRRLQLVPRGHLGLQWHLFRGRSDVIA